MKTVSSVTDQNNQALPITANQKCCSIKETTAMLRRGHIIRHQSGQSLS
jgi:hypothetical protein